MKVKYDKEADLLIIELSDKPFEYAAQEGNVIVHYATQEEPVLIEILEGAEFLKKANQSLPVDIKKDLLKQPQVVAHKIRK